MINKRLFQALERMFGRGNVKIVNEDRPFKARYVEDFDDRRGTVLRMRRARSGEEYHVRCPRCNDYKQRLSISHMWGVLDETSDSRNLWLMQCWNEDCYSNYEARKDLYDRLFEDLFVGEESDSRPVVQDGKIKVRYKPEIPGKMWRLDRMAIKAPKHPAIRYVQQRMLCSEHLGLRWGVGYCPDPWLQCAANRLIAPIRMDGKLLGWSGRWIGEPTSKETPKWYHDSNMVKSELLYNYDEASKLHTKILVEGCGDVWGVGDPGLAVLGKTISPEQIKLLRKCCRDDFAIVLMFDPAQNEKERQKGKKHHMEVAFDALSEVSRFKNKIVKVYLSDDLDPGDADRGYLYGLIRYRAQQENIHIVLPET